MTMTLYDLIFLGVLLFSVIVGLMRGGTRELVTLVSFIASFLIAIWIMPWLKDVFNLKNMTAFIAFGIIFVIIYLSIRMFGNNLSEKMHKQKALDYVDRVLGFSFGILRALVFLGVFHLLFAAIFPIGSRAEWFTEAKVYPLGVTAAKTLQAVAPKLAVFADQVAPSVEDSTS
jgi:membrane protein required for colicin V production